MHKPDQHACQSREVDPLHVASNPLSYADNNQIKGKSSKPSGNENMHAKIDVEMIHIEEGNEDLDEAEEMELGEMDLQGIVDACARKEFNSIPDKKIQLLQTTILNSKSKPTSTNKGKKSVSYSLEINNAISP
jgi:hypothetical protein